MKYVKIVWAVAVMLTVCSCSSIPFIGKKKADKPVYAFGIAASFTDTLVYYTDVQLIDSVHLAKDGALPQQELYSYQLKNFVEANLGSHNRTCMIYYKGKKKRIDKEQSKVLGKYKKNKSNNLIHIDPKEFKFVKPEEQ